MGPVLLPERFRGGCSFGADRGLCCGADSPDPTPVGIQDAGRVWRTLRCRQGRDCCAAVPACQALGLARRGGVVFQPSMLRSRLSGMASIAAAVTRLVIATYQAGAALLPVASISQVTTNCVVPPNSETPTA